MIMLIASFCLSKIKDSLIILVCRGLGHQLYQLMLLESNGLSSLYIVLCCISEQYCILNGKKQLI